VSSPLHLLWIFLKLGLTSFGGPVAHIAFFRQEFVARRGWMTDAAFTELVGVCQFLPGPASSQLGMAIGLSRAGYPGAAAAWLGFTLPSALIMIGAALGLSVFGSVIPTGILLGLKIVVVAVVAQAVWEWADRSVPMRCVPESWCWPRVLPFFLRRPRASG